jgi:hypothetical protein
MFGDNVKESLRKLKLKKAANISGIEDIDRKASKRDFLHVWDITGILYIVLGIVFFVLCVLVLYTVLSTNISLNRASTATDIQTITSNAHLKDVDVHYVVIPSQDAELDVVLPAPTYQGSYISIVCATEFTQNGLDIVDDSQITVHYGTYSTVLKRTEGVMFMVNEGAWSIIRIWTTPIQNP